MILDNRRNIPSALWVVGVVLSIYGVLALLVAVRVMPPLLYVGVTVFIGIMFLFLSARGTQEVYVRLYFAYAVLGWVSVSLVRRLGDQVWGWSDLNVYSISPVFVSFFSVFFISSLVFGFQKFLFVSTLLLIVQVYGFLVGVWYVGIYASAYACLTWVVPVVFLIYMVGNVRWIDSYVKDLYVLSVCIVLITACYGLVQYFFLPAWDMLWVANVPMTSVGAPIPMQFRLFSTMHSPMVYAPVLAMLMLFILSRRSFGVYLILALAVLALGLTYVRAAWLIFVMGFLAYVIWLSRFDFRFGIRVMVSIFLSFVLFLSLVSGTEVGIAIFERVDTMVNLEGDTSYNARIEFYIDMFGYALNNFIGDGMGSVGRAQTLAYGQNVDTVFDSGILQIFVLFGLFFGLTYFLLLILLVSLVKSNLFEPRADYAIASIIVIVMLIQLVFSNRLVGPIGFFMFVFLGIAIAGRYSRKVGDM